MSKPIPLPSSGGAWTVQRGRLVQTEKPTASASGKSRRKAQADHDAPSKRQVRQARPAEPKPAATPESEKE